MRVPEPYGSGAPEAGGSEDSDADPEAGGPPLLVGKFVDVELDGVAPEAWFRIRRPALRPGNEVWVVRDDKVTIVPVTVLQRAEDEVYLTGALQPGDAAIVGGLQIATEGMAVRGTGAGTP